ncbi:MAG: hypothetical protein KatS3mg006_2287 [Pyrinomonadaceae bacterium]|jgi:hypothetical protein|nr:MAG: hypothetical protein KatS3mg006_2287 [Pyrinomonadaceae bacterium]
MKKVIALGLLAISCFFYEARAQSFSTRIVRIEIDGKEVKKDYKVFFFSNGKWIEAKRTPTGFVIPNELRNEEYLTVLISFGKYKLKFSEIHISKFDQNWTVGIDKKPFSEEFVKPEEAKTTKRVYYIQFGGSGLISTQLVVIEKKTE